MTIYNILESYICIIWHRYLLFGINKYW